MATYVIGDIQGCFYQLKCVLKKASFNPAEDKLWVVGDLVNRGPASLETLRYIYNLGDHCKIVLGNHDLHLLAIAHGVHPQKKQDTLNDILTAPDRDQLLDWLRHQPLVYYDETNNVAMVHAGIPPQWSIKKALARAAEVEEVLQGEHFVDFLSNMYGNQPNRWDKNLKGWPRLRLITNYFTRMRFCNWQGELELSAKGSPKEGPKGYKPWYLHTKRKARETTILFGHWAALEGKTNSSSHNVFALDTGCVWGNHLTLMNLESKKTTTCRCKTQ
ncbi:symmetrical bis(5'-nucleosyl)-tetraphosphatase [Spartinivicinus ruber]|uniref:symmetrical bis(5'-nucleosyl)-tetraphosphatase n=1 Tax=Spartinivicinus ruber TaxID=2683272 RepID=UPI0013D0976D|nr:symmetrical bis(5'-nucleosyl)-tetraphosphatase [Spartinivicinus ruber]